MKIFFRSDNQPLMIDPKEGSIHATPDTRTYISMGGPQKGMPTRHDGELIMENGWVCLDFDSRGFLVGLELVEGDPMTGVTNWIPYLQPTNPLIQ